MQIPITLVYLAATVPTVLGDGLSDFKKLKIMIQLATNNTLASVPTANTTTPSGTAASAQAVPTTMPFDTASTVQNISYAFGACTAEFKENRLAYPNQRNITANDAGYFSMINEILSLAVALTTRGRAPHDEINAPVSQAIDGLARGVHDYGLGLSHYDVVLDRSTIRTITAENALVDAELAWSYSIPSPAQKVKRWFVG